MSEESSKLQGKLRWGVAGVAGTLLLAGLGGAGYVAALLIFADDQRSLSERAGAAAVDKAVEVAPDVARGAADAAGKLASAAGDELKEKYGTDSLSEAMIAAGKEKYGQYKEEHLDGKGLTEIAKEKAKAKLAEKLEAKLPGASKVIGAVKDFKGAAADAAGGEGTAASGRLETKDGDGLAQVALLPTIPKLKTPAWKMSDPNHLRMIVTRVEATKRQAGGVMGMMGMEVYDFRPDYDIPPDFGYQANTGFTWAMREGEADPDPARLPWSVEGEPVRYVTGNQFRTSPGGKLNKNRNLHRFNMRRYRGVGDVAVITGWLDVPHAQEVTLDVAFPGSAARENFCRIAIGVGDGVVHPYWVGDIRRTIRDLSKAQTKEFGLTQGIYLHRGRYHVRAHVGCEAIDGLNAGVPFMLALEGDGISVVPDREASPVEAVKLEQVAPASAAPAFTFD